MFHWPCLLPAMLSWSISHHQPSADYCSHKSYHVTIMYQAPESSSEFAPRAAWNLDKSAFEAFSLHDKWRCVRNSLLPWAMNFFRTSVDTSQTGSCTQGGSLHAISNSTNRERLRKVKMHSLPRSIWHIVQTPEIILADPSMQEDSEG